MRKHTSKKHWKIIAVLVILAMVLGCVYYVNDYYKALPEALEVVGEPAKGINVTEEKNDRIVFTPESAEAGLVFYPGGKVQYEAYAPLMEACAEQGILCVLIHMPANLAVLDADAAGGITGEYPDIDTWYIGGHSLGGSMAASYAAKHTEEIDGVVLLASYSTAELQNSGLEVVSIYGTEDKVLDWGKYEKYRVNLPADTTEKRIEGGNHAYFGMYGLQKGDGEATIANELQIQTAADIIAAEILEK